jgi:hypothetical protein
MIVLCIRYAIDQNKLKDFGEYARRWPDPIITGSLMSAENNVLLCPRMDAAAVRAGELLCSYFGRLPAFFFYCLPGIGQL